MAKIRMCASLSCSRLIGVWERPNKKFCSQECKTKANNNKNREEKNWEKVLDDYNNLPQDAYIPFPKWLKDNYYPPRKIKNKKQQL